MSKLVDVYELPTIRATKDEEDIYRREFGRVICAHGVYLPNKHCPPCAKKAQDEVREMMEKQLSHLESVTPFGWIAEERAPIPDYDPNASVEDPKPTLKKPDKKPIRELFGEDMDD